MGWGRKRTRVNVQSVGSFNETFRQRARSGSAEFLFAEIRNAFDPNSKFIQTWQQLTLLCIVYEALLLPFQATFADVETTVQTKNALIGVYVCEMFFCLDIYVQLHTGYYEDGNVLRDTSKSRMKYLRSWAFALDLAALPPLSLFPIKLKFSPAILEFHKFLRLWRVPRLIALLDDIYARHFELLKLAKVLGITVIVSHFVACGRFLFGYDIHHHNHWLPKSPNDAHSVERKYLMSLFWAFGLLTGLFEGELPYRPTEFVFTIVVAICGFSLFTYFCATFFMISKCEGGERERAEARVNQFKHLLAFHRVPTTLQKQAVDYLKRYYTQAESNDREVARLLCPSITIDIQVELLQGTVAGIPVFKNCDTQFIKAVTSLLEIVSYPAQFVLFRAGDHGDAMYVVSAGVLHTVVNGVKVRELRKGSFFGEVAVFAKLPRSATMITTTYCMLYRLSRFHADKLLEGYPRCARLIRHTVNQMLKSVKDGDNKTLEDMAAPSGDMTLTRKKSRAALLYVGALKRTLTGKKRGTIQPAPSDGSIPSPPSSPKAERNTKDARVAPAKTVEYLSDVGPPTLKSTTSSPTSLPTGVLSPTELELAQMPATRRSSYKVAPTIIVPEEVKSRPFKSDTRRGSAGMMLKQLSKTQLDLFKRSWRRLSIEAKAPDAMKGFYDRIQRMAPPMSPKKRWWSMLLRKKCIDPETRLRMVWLLVLQFDLCYNWVMIPLQLSFPLFDRPIWYIEALNMLADAVLWIDIYLNFNLAFTQNSEKIMDTMRSAHRYFMSRAFIADVVLVSPYGCMVPFWAGHVFPRVPRLFRAWRLRGHFAEVAEYFVITSRQRLLCFGLLLLLLYHIVACIHFSITYIEGFSSKEEAWIPSDDIFLEQINSTTCVDVHGHYYASDSDEVSRIRAMQYFRSLYYAANVLAALGKTIEPSSDNQYTAALIFMLSGFVITAIVVDNVQKYFTASALEQKEFFATRTRIQLFLKRQDAPLSIHQRVNSFLDYWWSSHRGAIIEELLQELPEIIKRDIVRSICKPVMDTLSLLFPNDPASPSVDPTMSESRQQMEEFFLDNVRFVLYGQGEILYRRGDYPSGLYFLLEGHLIAEAGSNPPRRVPIGGFFGVAALSPSDPAAASIQGHREQVTALSGCIVIYMAKENLVTIEVLYPSFSIALRLLDRRLATTRIKRSSDILDISCLSNDSRVNSVIQVQSAWRFSSLEIWRYIRGEECFDPDSTSIAVWELFVFVVITIQAMKVIYTGCFGSSSKHAGVFMKEDLYTVLAEMCFVLDTFIRFRLGFYEYGNKVMTLRRIKAHYVMSRHFWIDVLALLPFFVVNWLLPRSYPRVEVLNANKLLRLLKSPHHFKSLEAKYVKLSVEIRLFRLVFYSYLAMHLFGCIWFNFAAHTTDFDNTTTSTLRSFGENRWMPPKELEFADRSLQYFSSVFWAYGLMSASNTGELPKTVSQCIFSVLTMTVGFFLFAYVVGNFLDMIELHDSENRHFIAKLSSLRHLLAHFMLPPGIEVKFKTFFFFKRFHSITQEHVLERVLPPSLLIDIRMFQLQPMIVKVAFLTGMEDSVTRMLVSLFTQSLVVKDEYICKYGEAGSEMYFIFTGVLDIYVPTSSPPSGVGVAVASHRESNRSETGEGLQKVNQITAGNYFGEAALFTNAPRNAYVKAKTSCILYRLSRQSLELVFERFPEWKLKVLRIIKIQQEQQRLKRMAAEVQKVDTASKRRSSKKTMTRIDLINSRAEDMEALVLSSARGGHDSKVVSLTGLIKRSKVVRLLREWTEPATKRLYRWSKLLLKGVEAQSPFYLFWLRLVALSTMYMAIIIPYRCAYDDLNRWNPIPVTLRVLEAFCDLVYWWDIWFQFRVQESQAAMELYEQDHLQAYKRERLLWDLLAAFPVDHYTSDLFWATDHANVNIWLRLNRCFKVYNLAYYRNEIHRQSVRYELNHFLTLWLLYLLVIYWTSCLYMTIAMQDGFGDEWQAWLPVKELAHTDNPRLLMLRIFRGLFFATTAFVKKGRTFFPMTTLDNVFSITFCFIGQLIMALMIGEIASVYILSIDNEVEFQKNHIAVELFLSRKRLSPALKSRTNAFLTSWWSSHAGVNYQSVFEDLPLTVRTEGVLFIADRPLSRFMDQVFRPLTRQSALDSSDSATVDQLMKNIAKHLRFEGYPRGENVIVEGTVCKAVHFVVRGYLYSKSMSNPVLYHAGRFRAGDYFGEKGLLGHSVSMFTVTTVRACDLFVLSSEDLLDLIKSHPFFSIVLKMAQEMIRQRKTFSEYFSDGKNKDRRDTLRRRLSAPILSQSARNLLGDEVGLPSLGLEGDNQVSRILRLAYETEWEEAFQLFREMLLPKGSMDDISGRVDDEEEMLGPTLDNTVTSQPVLTRVTRLKRARSQMSESSSEFWSAKSMKDLSTETSAGARDSPTSPTSQLLAAVTSDESSSPTILDTMGSSLRPHTPSVPTVTRTDMLENPLFGMTRVATMSARVIPRVPQLTKMPNVNTLQPAVEEGDGEKMTSDS
ncbi:hypothetical protein Poli38472_000048 [Pythium oligandrum]|uniref:Uncharacterized protein n=1 Tax=Pythium oligandrum TaxID=41045 RepID=A0A8K1CB09_PYTOL|nr:hypothetical protein Poli38472_000048 [Pythium oligandrum]|eukprot:TMW60006.1 hypothetical protein Poli38472_000048 [Pythium oligandrum]